MMVKYYNELVPEHQDDIELYRTRGPLPPMLTPEAHHRYLVYLVVLEYGM
jgi:hypothetical protein